MAISVEFRVTIDALERDRARIVAAARRLRVASQTLDARASVLASAAAGLTQATTRTGFAAIGRLRGR